MNLSVPDSEIQTHRYVTRCDLGQAIECRECEAQMTVVVECRSKNEVFKHVACDDFSDQKVTVSTRQQENNRGCLERHFTTPGECERFWSGLEGAAKEGSVPHDHWNL